MRGVAALALCAACGFHPNVVAGDGDGGTTDGDAPGHDSMPPPEAIGPGCYGTGFITVCPVTMPSNPLHIGNMHINTDDTTGTCIPLDPPQPVCVIAGSDVKIQNFLSAEGSKPLIVLSLSTLDVMGTIDVASHRSGSPQASGAGASTATCVTRDAVGDTGGGAGGSFGTKGGNGADEGTHTNGGTASTEITPTALRGGCPGGHGRPFTATENEGGRGGGVVDLISVMSISIGPAAEINASGEGGGGASPVNTGGGGGGAGGLIVFDAPTLSYDSFGVIYANGGGGGGATSDNTVAEGSSGTDPSNYNFGGNGGFGVPGMFQSNPAGGSGGDGASFTNTGADNGHDGRHGGGGGGGGGGFGVIKVLQAAPPNGRISPPAI